MSLGDVEMRSDRPLDTPRGSPDPEPSSSRIAALVRLLGDDDSRICSVAWANLEKLGKAVLPFVEQATRDGQDSRVQVQCVRFLQEWRRRDALSRWIDFSKKPPLGLESGAFLIAETEYPDADVARHRAQLDEYADALRGRVAKARSVDEAVGEISSFLFEEVGFRGSQEDYYDPENSYITRVMERKRGIPISLSAVFLFVARRLAVPVHGVGLPQHFVLKYRGSSGDVFVDAFHGGRILSVRDCVQFLSRAHIPFLEDCLRVVSDGEMLTRMLGNLLRIYLAKDDQRRCDRVAIMLKLLS